ncbi:MAG: exodeoxyribonuclease VII small subunit [Gammaproteobacteria bacterium]|jgi:exodeoxyribonuclease VII small subunit|nr:exodeoxyribonuclease VII small subunit [Gammaproteobacteria bacterium]NBT44842.1 exodeoxyribonuclease VII small subunit [Gammaproteobacteria bacterium]NBY23181.1 exodeoxyribonuclease VII small subunit [Gammaproteobacteria bacterium]NDE33796.1 exodeoxyribonuclease VII small subunit [Gammaproteobacteria bacterium]NDE55712.1 exodeoxyribonuclease VII small subunit [Gammaproteobacteria bacterium]
MTQESDTFKANYAILKEVAETLRTQKEPDIDALIPMVDQALAAYKVCKDRLTAVKAAFGERLPEDMPE